MSDISAEVERIEARPTAEFSVHFIEDLDFDDPPVAVVDRQPDHAVRVHVQLAGLSAGTLVMNEVEWATLWDALRAIDAVGVFDRKGLVVYRTGPLR